MSRSFGGTSLTTRPPIAISPSVISSSPAIIRSRVDLPQPDGPDEHDELAVGDVDVDAVDDLGAAEPLLHAADLDRRHSRASSCRSAAARSQSAHAGDGISTRETRSVTKLYDDNTTCEPTPQGAPSR